MTTATAATLPAAETGDVLRKRQATLQAQLALRGFALHQLPAGGFLIARHDMSRAAPDLRSVQALLQQMQEGR